MRAFHLTGFLSLLLLSSAALSSAQSGLWVEMPTSKAPSDVYRATDHAVRLYNKNLAELSRAHVERLKRAGLYSRRAPLTFPTIVHLEQNGRRLPAAPRAPGDLELVFDTTGGRAFPQAYRDLLQSVFNSAMPTMDIVFGRPNGGGQILVKNYDADIGDRDAVAGGYYLPNNGSGGKEIRFPIYTSPEATAVNFVHTLLLAYTGSTTYGFDAFQEGLVRAATMQIVRTAGALPNTLEPLSVEAVLDNTYDVGPFYDWYNQPALAGAQFVASNLRDVPLPPGGSLGGIYLLRYQMAGTAWFKAIVENPGFIAEFNRRFYLNPTVASDPAALVAVGQAALDTVKGQANATLEGMTFTNWFRRQFILNTNTVRGTKIHVQPIPIANGLAGPDFGVFDITTHWFETTAGGNEILLSGTSFPIFWDDTFFRLFPGAQEDVMAIAGAYGSVTPNLPNLYGGATYRATVDIPVLDRVARAYLPAGAVATAANPTINDFYGTVIGLPLTNGQSAKVKVTHGATSTTVPVSRFSFGTRIDTQAYVGPQRLRVEVIRTVAGVDTIVLTRFVNKGPGQLALDLRVNGDVNVTVPITRGIQTIGFPVEPFAIGAENVFNLPTNQILLARYNPAKAAYDFYPDFGHVYQGLGYFYRSNVTNGAFTVEGRTHPTTPIAVALRPGWNMVTTPLNSLTPTTSVEVIRATDVPVTFADAKGIELGNDFFQFNPGANDAASGAPETGTMVAATSFEPGKAYFVRVLSPEGATLLFKPATGGPAKPNIRKPVPTTGWRILATLLLGSERSEVMIGQSNTATEGFDRREDSPLAPGIGGMQIWAQGNERLYKDLRMTGRGSTYTLNMEGLKPGKMYTLNFRTVFGNQNTFTLKGPFPYDFHMRSGDSHKFVANGTTYSVQVIVGGVN